MPPRNVIVMIDSYNPTVTCYPGVSVPASILVVEDEPAIQDLIAMNLEHAGHSVLRARDTEQAAGMVRSVLPDVVLLDWMLPGQSGLAFARRLREDERTRTVPIIMLTGRGSENGMSGVDAGADDYLPKPFSPRELVARIKAVLRRRSPQLADEPVEVSGLRLDPGAHRVMAEGTPIELGPTEFRLLHFFMTHPERVHSRAQLLDKVWGDNVFVEERTVDVHIRRLRMGLERTGHDRLVQTVRGSGYRFAAQSARPQSGAV
jgi:two-component system, OmpR family, phosphate regulon response regulator PhoB